ncbi:MAG: leucine-rich repeat protein [Bacteroidales bacterium]|nr:leucine-rich repeat protein [Bacteroidales bacterium]
MRLNEIIPYCNKHLSFFPMFACMCMLVCSCSTEDAENAEYANSELMGTKWTLTSSDYSIGDEYIGIHEETYTIYFHSLYEGVFYYGRKDDYSDQGSSSERKASHFKYYLSGKKLTLEYFTDKIVNMTQFTLDGNTLTCDPSIFTRSTLTSADREWLNTIHGTTGACSWYSDMNGSLWIKGDGAMANYSSYESTPWAVNDRTPYSVLVIDEGVTNIGSYAFADASIALVSTLPESLQRVENGAFKGSSIASMTLNDNTTYIGDEAFADCDALWHFGFPENLVTIGDAAFSGCTALICYNLDFGESLRTIGDYAFEGAAVRALTFAEGVQSIGNYAFQGIREALTLPNSLTSIGATAFSGSFKKIELGSGVTQIGDKAFITSITSGEMYVNRAVPPSAGNCIIAEATYWNAAESGWTLYVPTGSKSLYAAQSPWNKFKSFVEDESLEGSGSNSDDTNEEEDDSPQTGTINGHEYIDLGLSVKWATCNVGASSPSDCGDYFAWGETSTKSSYDIDNCITEGIEWDRIPSCFITTIVVFGRMLPVTDVTKGNWCVLSQIEKCSALIKLI